ncbi:MAG TPA: hypothetical protein ENK02_14730 [Planctomycetes bacterium]|nr:hypothetical protein [Planctomycetota bacterium]
MTGRRFSVPILFFFVGGFLFTEGSRFLQDNRVFQLQAGCQLTIGSGELGQGIYLKNQEKGNVVFLGFSPTKDPLIVLKNGVYQVGAGVSPKKCVLTLQRLIKGETKNGVRMELDKGSNFLNVYDNAGSLVINQRVDLKPKKAVIGLYQGDAKGGVERSLILSNEPQRRLCGLYLKDPSGQMILEKSQDHAVIEGMMENEEPGKKRFHLFVNKNGDIGFESIRGDLRGVAMLDQKGEGAGFAAIKMLSHKPSLITMGVSKEGTPRIQLIKQGKEVKKIDGE